MPDMHFMTLTGKSPIAFPIKANYHLMHIRVMTYSNYTPNNMTHTEGIPNRL